MTFTKLRCKIIISDKVPKRAIEGVCLVEVSLNLVRKLVRVFTIVSKVRKRNNICKTYGEKIKLDSKTGFEYFKDFLAA